MNSARKLLPDNKPDYLETEFAQDADNQLSYEKMVFQRN
jgi:hypothetical protein